MEVIVADTLRLIQLACQKLPDLSELSARDLFAMSAMNGFLANNITSGNSEDFANMAYKFADAMLEARRTK